MKGISKFLYAIAIAALFSFAICILMKQFGIEWFSMQLNSSNSFDTVLKYIINTIILALQFYLIVGCVVAFKPKVLAYRIIPYLFLITLFYFLPEKIYVHLNILIIFVTCITLRPSGRTVIMFILNIGLISIIQLSLIWLRLGVAQRIHVYDDHVSLLLMNIDHIIIYASIYYINLKVGEKNDYFAIFRKSRQRKVS